MKKLVVIPSEPISEYEKKGLKNLERYYNPGLFFDEVYVISLWEKEKCFKHGMNIIPIKDKEEYKLQIEKIKPDIIRSYGGYWASQLACLNRVKNIPVICSVHDTNKLLIYKSLKFADAHIYMTKAVENKVKSIVDCSHVSSFILPNRVDIDNNTRYENLDIPFVKYILHVGRKTEQKNIFNVIKALKNLPDDINLILVGAGDFKIYEDFIISENLTNRILNIDRVDNDKLKSFYKNAIALVVPSRWEGFGVVFIEAQAHECPVITSNIAPMNEFLNNENAILINDYESEDEIAKAVLSIDNNSKFRRDIIINAKANVRQFSRGNIEKREIEIYKKVIFGNKIIDNFKFKNFHYYIIDFYFRIFRMVENKVKGIL